MHVLFKKIYFKKYLTGRVLRSVGCHNSICVRLSGSEVVLQNRGGRGIGARGRVWLQLVSGICWCRREQEPAGASLRHQSRSPQEWVSGTGRGRSPQDVVSGNHCCRRLTVGSYTVATPGVKETRSRLPASCLWGDRGQSTLTEAEDSVWCDGVVTGGGVKTLRVTLWSVFWHMMRCADN